MHDFYELSTEFDNNLKAVINNSVNEIAPWFNSDFKTFVPGNLDYDLYINSLKSANQLFISNIRSYHQWLTDNFIISPKNQ